MQLIYHLTVYLISFEVHYLCDSNDGAIKLLKMDSLELGSNIPMSVLTN